MNLQAKRLRDKASKHFSGQLPTLREGKLSRKFSVSHDCLWYRSPWPWTGFNAKPEDIVDYHSQVFYWNPLGVPVKPACPDCGQTDKVEGGGVLATHRPIHSTRANPGAMAGNMYVLGIAYKHPNCTEHKGTSKTNTTRFDSLDVHFNSQLPPFVLGMNPFALTACSGIDKGDVEASRSMLWRFETAKQAASFNEQKQAAYVNMEYLYLHYRYGLKEGLGLIGLHCSFQLPDFKPFSSGEEFAGEELYPAFLGKVTVQYQQPTFDMQKRVLTTIQTDTRIVKWDAQHAIKGKVKLSNATTGKREAAATRTFVVIGGCGQFLGAQQRLGNSIKETKNFRDAVVDRHKGAQALVVAYTDNPSAELNDLRRDHPQLEYVLKDLYHSLRIVSDALDPTHPLAGKFREDWRNAHWIKALHIM